MGRGPLATEATVSTLELRRLSKKYDGGPWAVREVDLTVDEGTLLVIAGPSGCGKTTMLRMVAGLEEPSQGEVIIDGVVVNDVRTSERDIALASQSYALYPHMTVAENIGFPLRVDGVHRRRIDERVSRVARLLQLEDVLGRTPHQISGGQQQRTALGRAIIGDPRLLLLDEPMSNLDAKLRTQTGYVITQLQRRLGLTTLMVTHDQNEALAMGDRLAVMRDGRIVQSGRPIDVFDAPANIFVAQFVGTMAVVVGTVIESEGVLALRVGSRVLPLDPAALRRHPSLPSHAGRRVAVGLRPDALRRDTSGPVALDVLSTTCVGRDRIVGLEIDAPRITQHATYIEVHEERTSTIVMSADLRDEVSLWEPCRVSIDTSRIHVFDISTGTRIT